MLRARLIAGRHRVPLDRPAGVMLQEMSHFDRENESESRGLLVKVVSVAAVGLLALGLAACSSAPSASRQINPKSQSARTLPSVSTTSTPSTATDVPVTAASLPGIPPCASGTTSPVIRPTTLYLSCGDGGLSVTDITWSSWGSASAYGNGTLHVNNCVPDCADGTYSNYPSGIEVSNPNDSSGVAVFQDVSVIPSGGAGQAQSNDSPGAWGAP